MAGDMIRAYNIVSGKYNNKPTVKLNLSRVSNAGVDIYKMQSTPTFLAVDMLIYGIVYITLLFLQSLLKHFKIV